MKFTYPEAATPLDDISDLKPTWVKTQEDLNNVEAENISSAASKYLLKPVGLPHEWFNIPFLKKIHYDMFHDVWGWAGKFRTTQTCPGISPHQIYGALAHLCDDVLCLTLGTSLHRPSSLRKGNDAAVQQSECREFYKTRSANAFSFDAIKKPPSPP